MEHIFINRTIGKINTKTNSIGAKGTVLYPTAGLAAGLISDPKWAVETIKAYNNWLEDRYTSKDERLYGAGIVPQWHGQNVKSYIGRLIILVLVMILIVLAIGIASGALILATQSVLVIWFVAIGIAMGISWVAVRIGLILPAAALGEKMRIAESWQATKPVSTDILVPIVIIAISITVLSGAVEAIFGSTLVGLVLVAGVYWIQILLNLSLMTTVYGMQIEGRSLS